MPTQLEFFFHRGLQMQIKNAAAPCAEYTKNKRNRRVVVPFGTLIPKDMRSAADRLRTACLSVSTSRTEQQHDGSFYFLYTPHMARQHF